MSLHTLILAAGAGHRFDGPIKQLAPIQGQTLLTRSLRLASAITPGKVSVVLGYEYQHLSLLITGADIVINSNWQRGIGHSIAMGVGALPSTASAVLILLCDQVALTAEDLALLRDRYWELMNNHQDHSLPIVCAAYAGGVGVPAIFPRDYFSQLMVLDGDVGAKHLLQNNFVVSIPMDNAKIDIDTQDDWLKFQSK